MRCPSSRGASPCAPHGPKSPCAPHGPPGPTAARAARRCCGAHLLRRVGAGAKGTIGARHPRARTQSLFPSSPSPRAAARNRSSCPNRRRGTGGGVGVGGHGIRYILSSWRSSRKAAAGPSLTRGHRGDGPRETLPPHCSRFTAALKFEKTHGSAECLFRGVLRRSNLRGTPPRRSCSSPGRLSAARHQPGPLLAAGPCW